MKYASFILVSLLAGCALTPQQAELKTNYELCSIARTSPMDQRRQAALTELRSRNGDCKDYEIARAYNMQNSINAMSAGASIMNSSRSYNPPPVSCTYTNLGGTVVQNCR